MTWYENWQKWGMEVTDIKAKLKENMEWKNNFEDLYNSGIQVITHMINNIQNDHSIPWNHITWHPNKLVSLKETLTERYNACKGKEISVDEESINFIAWLIDENETLYNLLLIWDKEQTNYIQNYATNVPMSIDNGYIRLDQWADNYKIKDLLNIFYDRTVTEHYKYEGTDITIPNFITEREINNLSKKYYFDYITVLIKLNKNLENSHIL